MRKDIHTFGRNALKPAIWIIGFVAAGMVVAVHANAAVLSADNFKHYIDQFNSTDDQPFRQTYPNDQAWAFLSKNMPLFTCPDADVERTYYFRWWTYRKHVRQTAGGFVVTEFMPDVPWAGKYNTISAAAFHHIREGRWLADDTIARDYLEMMLLKGGSPRAYTWPAAVSVWDLYQARPDKNWTVKMLPALVANHRAWEKAHRDANGLFWTLDTADGMEISAGGHGYRPTINACMYGDDRAIANIARLADDPAIATSFDADADHLRELVLAHLWSDKTRFFHTEYRPVNAKPRPDQPVTDPATRELMGYEPWMFDLPPVGHGYETAWAQLKDPQGFQAPFGPTTAERRSPLYRIKYDGHECQWCGPSWPFATSFTLDALGNVLRDYTQDVVTRQDYLDLMLTYTHSQQLKLPDGKVVPWIDEDLDPITGTWIARQRLADLKQQHKGNPLEFANRGQDYNHSTYNDLIITGLCGLVPRADDQLEINALLPSKAWDWFCLDHVPYHGHTITIAWDKDGSHFNRGAGLLVEVDNELAGTSPTLTRLILPLRSAH